MAAFLHDRRGFHHPAWHQTARSVGAALNALYYLELMARRERRSVTLIQLVEQAAFAAHADVTRLQRIHHHDRLTEPGWITQHNRMVDAVQIVNGMLQGAVRS